MLHLSRSHLWEAGKTKFKLYCSSRFNITNWNDGNEESPMESNFEFCQTVVICELDPFCEKFSISEQKFVVDRWLHRDQDGCNLLELFLELLRI